jgi:hypothetical protein
MRATRHLTIVTFAAVATLIGGCKRTPESSIRELIGLLKETTTVLKSITDENSARAASPKLRRIGEKMDALKAETDKLPKPTDADSKALMAKYQNEMFAAVMELSQERMRVIGDPKLSGALRYVPEIR